MNEFIEQLEPMLEDGDLIKALSVLPKYKNELKTKSERLAALIDIYKIYIPDSDLYLYVLNKFHSLREK